MVGEGITGYNTPFEEWPEEVKKGYMYDPKGAEALLDEAGYPRGADGTRFKTVLNHFFRFPLGYSELAASYWADIGVDVEINVMDEATAGARRVDTFAERTWEGMIGTVLGSQLHAAAILYVPQLTLHSTSALLTTTESGTQSWTPLLKPPKPLPPLRSMQRLVKEVDMYTIENHWNIWGPKAGKFMAHQPWVIGYNGETLAFGAGPLALIFARLWIDSALKAEMGH